MFQGWKGLKEEAGKELKFPECWLLCARHFKNSIALILRIAQSGRYDGP